MKWCKRGEELTSIADRIAHTLSEMSSELRSLKERISVLENTKHIEVGVDKSLPLTTDKRDLP